MNGLSSDGGNRGALDGYNDLRTWTKDYLRSYG